MKGEPSVLYICPTPIGNLGDVTLRVLEVLRSADLVACEDTRHTRILLDRHGITARLMSFHGFNEHQRLEALLPLLREGKDVALVSDAGMPGLSDPGFSLVRACAAEDIPVTVLPGPSAISTALVASGLPSDHFAFVGFLPRGGAKAVDHLARFDGAGLTLVAFESPRRLGGTLRALAERWPERRLAVCRELSKLHEQVARGTAAEVLGQLDEPVRGEVVLVIEAAAEAKGGLRPGSGPRSTGVETRARRALEELMRVGVGTKTAAAVVARLTGVSAKRTYSMALEVKQGEKVGPQATVDSAHRGGAASRGQAAGRGSAGKTG